jgi:VWFA-related protein
MRGVATAIGLVVGSAVVDGSAQQPVFRAGADAVVVDVSVLDRGRSVTDIGPGHFEVLDNGRPQKILDMSIEGMPLDVFLLLDSSGSMEAGAVARLRNAPQDLATVLRSGDRLELLGFAGRLARLRDESASAGQTDPGAGLTTLYDSLLAASMQPPDPARRRLLIVLSDGLDTASGVGHSIRWAVLDRSETVINVLRIADSYWAQQTSMGQRLYSYSWPLQEVAERTGGYYFDVRSTDDFTPLLRQSIEQFRRRYVLRYVPSDPSSGWHELKVTVRGKKYDVRHRRGYFR